MHTYINKINKCMNKLKQTKKQYNIARRIPTTVCHRMRSLKFRRHVAQEVRQILQYPLVEQNVVFFSEILNFRLYFTENHLF